jgi:nitrate reductase NapE component
MVNFREKVVNWVFLNLLAVLFSALSVGFVLGMGLFLTLLKIGLFGE